MATGIDDAEGVSTRMLRAFVEHPEARAYLGVGLLVVANRVTDSFGGGELILEGGTQTRPRVGGDRFFTDMALGIMIRAWGASNTSALGPSLRAQVGYAF